MTRYIPEAEHTTRRWCVAYDRGDGVLAEEWRESKASLRELLSLLYQSSTMTVHGVWSQKVVYKTPVDRTGDFPAPRPCQWQQATGWMGCSLPNGHPEEEDHVFTRDIPPTTRHNWLTM